MISENIRKFRRSHSLTQQQLAKMMNVSNGTIAMWETGKRVPDVASLVALAGIFETTVDTLIDMQTNMVGNSNRAYSNNIMYNGDIQSITISNGDKSTRELSEIECEIMNICQKLTTKQKMQLLSEAYRIEKEEEN